MSVFLEDEEFSEDLLVLNIWADFVALDKEMTERKGELFSLYRYLFPSKLYDILRLLSFCSILLNVI